MYRRFLIFCAKVLIGILRKTGNNGSALPGLIMERLHPTFLDKVLQPVEKRIILVTGTNGKTTTTKMIVAALRGSGKRVVTNGTGSNMTRGLIAALVDDMTYFGSLKDTDWFVFEMDEAYAPIFTQNIAPKAVVALNVLRDQLDRYGEIDITARMIVKAARRADTYIYNALDPLLAAPSAGLEKSGLVCVSYGVDKPLLAKVINEQSLHEQADISDLISSDVSLMSVDEVDHRLSVTIRVDDNAPDGRLSASIPLQGFHNALNAAAVAASLYAITPDDVAAGFKAISTMATPFGRGERLKLADKDISVALVKNPSGFTSNLQTFVVQGSPDTVLFVVNDNFADGRDVSWLWDVEFAGKMDKTTSILTSGVRGADMALRLKHDSYEAECTTNVQKAVESLMRSDAKDIVIIPTYTALFEVRSALSKYGKVARIW